MGCGRMEWIVGFTQGRAMHVGCAAAGSERQREDYERTALHRAPSGSQRAVRVAGGERERE